MAELEVAQEFLAESQEHLWRFQWTASYFDQLEAYARETLRPRLKQLQAWFLRDGSAKREWFGAAFSYVDCLAFHYLDEIDAFFPVVLAEFAELAALRLRVAAVAGISGYLESTHRPVVFGIGATGPKVDPRTAGSRPLRFSFPGAGEIDLTDLLAQQRRLTSYAG
jgi:hypothetical protein